MSGGDANPDVKNLISEAPLSMNRVSHFVSLTPSWNLFLQKVASATVQVCGKRHRSFM